MQFLLLATTLSVLALLVSEKTSFRPGVWVAKPLASTGFVVIALSSGALDSGFGQWILGAMLLSWLGDVFLIPKGSKQAFLVGLGSFLLAHLAFAGAFLTHGVALWGVVLAVPLLLILAWRVGTWLLPHVSSSMKGPVMSYMAAISVMVLMASGMAAWQHSPVVILAAVCFFVSDIAVARERFVAPGFSNKLWGLPLYYGAQMIFALQAGLV